ncbi:MAG TPA: hypothetical protein VMS79_05520 [Methanomassiliicoccales archaeon]|nr:hypothetical protein [Methanomassiliicoccales archaeon]
MSFRLRLVSLYFGQSAQRSNLLAVEQMTNSTLDSVLKQNVSGYKPPVLESVGRDLEAIRLRMAKGHKERIRILTGAIGKEKGIEVARAALFEAGRTLGEGARSRLGVKETKEDLELAARLIYRILGIDIEMIFDDAGGEMRVTRCTLSKEYDEEACIIMSATDEGMISGLSGRTTMKFKDHIPGGALCCTARIEFKESEK